MVADEGRTVDPVVALLLTLSLFIGCADDFGEGGRVLGEGYFRPPPPPPDDVTLADDVEVKPFVVGIPLLVPDID